MDLSCGPSAHFHAHSWTACCDNFCTMWCPLCVSDKSLTVRSCPCLAVFPTSQSIVPSHHVLCLCPFVDIQRLSTYMSLLFVPRGPQIIRQCSFQTLLFVPLMTLESKPVRFSWPLMLCGTRDKLEVTTPQKTPAGATLSHTRRCSGDVFREFHSLVPAVVLRQLRSQASIFPSCFCSHVPSCSSPRQFVSYTSFSSGLRSTFLPWFLTSFCDSGFIGQLWTDLRCCWSHRFPLGSNSLSSCPSFFF